MTRNVALFGALTALCLPGMAQTVRVDVAPEHVTNTIRPTEALGAGVDRLPYGTSDRLLSRAVIERVLAAGWQPVSYRQNTELHAEAWHWNPHGTFSEGDRGYWTSDADSPEPIDVSYGYRLPRRGSR